MFEYSLTDDGKVTLHSQVRKYAHSSCVKGVVLGREENGGVVGYSSGYDQRMKKWKVVGGEGALRVQKEGVWWHGLSDMNGMCKVGGRVVLVG